MKLPIIFSLRTTVVTLPAATSTALLPANPNRKYLCIQNVSTGDATLNFSATAVAGQGLVLSAGAAAGGQGAAWTWESTGVPQDAINAISTPGTVLVVLEGY